MYIRTKKEIEILITAFKEVRIFDKSTSIDGDRLRDYEASPDHCTFIIGVNSSYDEFNIFDMDHNEIISYS